uniref:NADH-ubiquinone oxidoreductase chain 4 n=1 Tax=Adicella ragma TaxID=2904898 RepID=A0A9E8RSX6_9NEOP|nr:NADH dehydrogenase subunit 4 [Adicella ragma]UZZ43722.1 NADH dehydrogenase subunit 4 [Adicella ragma]
MLKWLLLMVSFFFMLAEYWLVQLFLMVFMFMFLFTSLDSLSSMNLGVLMGSDLISFWLILLSIWVVILMFIASSLFYVNNYNIIMLSIVKLLLLIFLFLTFSVLDLFLFYLFFECTLIPMLLLIYGWGVQLERLEAAVYLLFYTMLVSLPLLGGIFYIYVLKKTMIFMFIEKMSFSNYLLYLVMLMAFLVKLPVIFIHLWLPKAHVEAPVSGSMILAGVMLKLGGYGMLRVMMMFEGILLKSSIIFMSLGLMGGVYLCLLCLFQIDFKKLVAYSSVVHMGLFLMGFVMMTNWGVKGSFYMLIGHGLCSSGMFSMINLNYERLHTRSLLLNKGMLSILPNFTFWWFLMLSSNMAAPFSLNLISEVSVINSLVSFSMFNLGFLLLLFFLSGVYNLYLYMVSQHGKFLLMKNNFFSLSIREYLLMLLHWIPLNLFFLKLEVLI